MQESSIPETDQGAIWNYFQNERTSSFAGSGARLGHLARRARALTSDAPSTVTSRARVLNIGVGDGIVKYTLIHGRDLRDTGDFIDESKPVQGVMLVQMLEVGRIQIEVFKGTTTADTFTSAAKVYVR